MKEPDLDGQVGKRAVVYVYAISLVAAMGGLLFGYDWVVIGGAKPFFEKCFQLDKGNLSGWANSCALLGCLLGSLVAGLLSDTFGRKRLLLTSAFLFAVSSVLTGWASTFFLFVVWRMAGGVAMARWRHVKKVTSSHSSWMRIAATLTA